MILSLKSHVFQLSNFPIFFAAATAFGFYQVFFELVEKCSLKSIIRNSFKQSSRTSSQAGFERCSDDFVYDR
jgi:hypothetical protein